MKDAPEIKWSTQGGCRGQKGIMGQVRPKYISLELKTIFLSKVAC